MIHGMQGQTRSEMIRTDAQYFEMAFPRVLAVAERAWHRAAWERDWSMGERYNATTGRQHGGYDARVRVWWWFCGTFAGGLVVAVGI
jgi:N-acetyl-beta-hexosaminidase